MWMQDLVPWMAWVGMLGVVIAVLWDLVKKFIKWRDPNKHLGDE